MGLFEIFRRIGKKDSSKWSDDEKRKISEAIDARNKEIEVIREEVFPGNGKPYRYYYENGQVRTEGFYYCLGFDKRGKIQDEKFQGKQIEYYENGQIKEIVFYKDGIPTGEYYSYDENGNLTFSQLPD